MNYILTGSQTKNTHNHHDSFTKQLQGRGDSLTRLRRDQMLGYTQPFQKMQKRKMADSLKSQITARLPNTNILKLPRMAKGY